MEKFAIDLDFMTIEEMKKDGIEWPPMYSPVVSLCPYIRRLGPCIGVEIGTERAESAYQMLDSCPNIDTLYTVDPYKEYENWNGVVVQETLDRYKEIARKNLHLFGERAVLVESTSEEMIQNFDKIVDFVYIDGSVKYDDILFDMKSWYAALRPGGLFMGHNYQLENVRNALKDFREEMRIRIPINRVSNFSFYWHKAKDAT